MELSESHEVPGAITLPYRLSQTTQDGSDNGAFVSLSRPALSYWQNWQKIMFDRIIGALLLIAVLPILITAAILIRIETKGPIFFRQTRIGLRNQTFRIYKFRTMYHDGNGESLNGKLQARRSDPRITRCGRWLRKLSIDELPQLMNVMKGDMSIVGPRPHPVNMQVDSQSLFDMLEDYHLRHRVLPGITGWAQVNGLRGETVVKAQIEQRVAHDLYYIENWSLLFDVRILLLTIKREILSKHAY